MKQQITSLAELTIPLSKISESGNSVVLFSPCATSFASFKNEFDRGQQFNALFEKLTVSSHAQS
jgi:UDP-N-acetylmuramoylalanine-D-glutamate ligase